MVSVRASLMLAVGLVLSCRQGPLGQSDVDPFPNAAASTAQAGPSAIAPAPTPTSPPPSAAPFGTAVAIGRYTCIDLQRGGAFRSFLASADTRTAFVNGDDWLALVNRSPTGALPPDYAPTDLVDVHDHSPRKAGECDSRRECLRSDAATALGRMLSTMKQDGLKGHVQSAFRGFGTQCWVFGGWAHKASGGFCEATEQSALPGHSQHQLGTTLDLFTQDWAEAGAKLGRGVFRTGFGCTPGGKWLDEQAWRFGFVVSYPIHPDDRKDGSRCETRTDRPVPIDPKTGYKHEPWHLRFVGIDAAAEYHQAWLASDPGTPREITLEQWLRARRGLVGDAELPVCDGCQCGACATLSGNEAEDKAPCGKASLALDGDGRVVAPVEEPEIVDATLTVTAGRVVVVAVTVRAAPHTPTQTPVFAEAGPVYGIDATYLAMVPYSGTAPHRYPDLPGAWRVAIEPVPPGSTRWPWRASLAAADLAATWNRANVVLPAKAGGSAVRTPIVLPEGTRKIRVALLRDGVTAGKASEERSLDVP